MRARRQFFLICVACVIAANAQAPPKAQARFEVATVRRSAARSSDSSKGVGRGGADQEFNVEHERFTAININLYALIVKAFGLTTCRALSGQCVLLSGGPDWIRKDGFDIRAKAPSGSPDYSLVQFNNGHAPQLNAMLRVLLEDRFHLKVHVEKRQLPVYALTKGNKGTKASERRSGRRIASLRLSRLLSRTATIPLGCSQRTARWKELAELLVEVHGPSSC